MESASGEQKSLLDFNKSDFEREMRRRKMAALEEYADFTFLVGAEKESAEVNLNLLSIKVINFYFAVDALFKG